MPAEVIKDNLNVLVELLYKLLSGSGRQEIPADLKEGHLVELINYKNL